MVALRECTHTACPRGIFKILACVGLGIVTTSTVDVHAIPIRVLAGAEISLAPTLSADGRSAQLRVQLRDDHGVGLGRAIELHIEAGASRVTAAVTTSERGVATERVAIPVGVSMLRIRATFRGDRAHSPAQHRLDWTPRSQQTVLTVLAPEAIDLERNRRTEIVVHALAQGLPMSTTAGWPMVLERDGQLWFQLRSDASGRAVQQVEADSWGGPGPHTLRAVMVHNGAESRSREIRVVVRALTSVIARAETQSDSTGALVIVGAVAWTGGGVQGGTVVIEREGRVIIGGSVDRRGSFTLRLPAEERRVGSRVRVRFVPNVPWYSGAESEEILIAQHPQTKVAWQLSLAFLLCAALILLGLKRRVPQRVPSAAQTISNGVEFVPSDDSVSHVVVIVVRDRSTGSVVSNVLVMCDQVRCEDQRVSFDSRDALDLQVSAPGYSPRGVRLEKRMSGTLTVLLSPWREAAWQIAKRWLGGALRTPKEARSLARKAEAESLRQAEVLVYGATEPDPKEVEALGHMDGPSLPKQ
ncbi:MAG: hypothetical protein Q8Q09_29275 [Deltaproteobacteria bacterium]|nr:hypothetical protein [Deltaproteobacteria bacterium]